MLRRSRARGLREEAHAGTPVESQPPSPKEDGDPNRDLSGERWFRGDPQDHDHDEAGVGPDPLRRAPPPPCPGRSRSRATQRGPPGESRPPRLPDRPNPRDRLGERSPLREVPGEVRRWMDGDDGHGCGRGRHPVRVGGGDDETPLLPLPGQDRRCTRSGRHPQRSPPDVPHDRRVGPEAYHVRFEGLDVIVATAPADHPDFATMRAAFPKGTAFMDRARRSRCRRTRCASGSTGTTTPTSHAFWTRAAVRRRAGASGIPRRAR